LQGSTPWAGARFLLQRGDGVRGIVVITKMLRHKKKQQKPRDFTPSRRLKRTKTAKNYKILKSRRAERNI